MKRNIDKKPNNDDVFDLVKSRAFELWNKEKPVQDEDWKYWFQAEREVKEELKKK